MLDTLFGTKSCKKKSSFESNLQGFSEAVLWASSLFYAAEAPFPALCNTSANMKQGVIIIKHISY